MRKSVAIIIFLLVLAPFNSHAQHFDHAKHMAEMNERGNAVMGFDRAKTTHHFLLLTNGGVIEVTANDPKDKTSLTQIRNHLSEIAAAFARGDFESPATVHDQTAPGSATLKKLKSAVKYRFEKTERGGG